MKRKPPAQRRFSGVAGSPLAQVEPSSSEPKGRGRPPKNKVAMTPAERKAASRAKQKAKLEDAERRDFVAELMRIYRRQQSDVVIIKGNVTGAQRRDEVSRQLERKYLSDLKNLSITDLKSTLDTQKETPDSFGRQPEEQTVGLGSAIEQIDAATRHDDPTAYMGTRKKLAGGYQVKPKGAAPDGEETDSDNSGRTSSSKPEHKPTASEKWKVLAIQSLISEMVFDSDAKCPFCEELFSIPSAAENHFEEQYGAGAREFKREERRRIIKEDVFGEVYTEPKTPGLIHFHGINQVIHSVRKSNRKGRNRIL